MNRPDKAVSSFKETFSCSQAVFATYAEEMGMDRETALKVACAFGGGMARMGGTCGAVTGAFMLIGLQYGKTRVDDEASKDKTYRLVRDFVDRFRERNTSILCRELLGVNLDTPDGLQAFKERDLHNTICAKLVRDASEIVERILREP